MTSLVQTELFGDENPTTMRSGQFKPHAIDRSLAGCFIPPPTLSALPLVRSLKRNAQPCLALELTPAVALSLILHPFPTSNLRYAVQPSEESPYNSNSSHPNAVAEEKRGQDRQSSHANARFL
jgi:hypothetical protein